MNIQNLSKFDLKTILELQHDLDVLDDDLLGFVYYGGAWSVCTMVGGRLFYANEWNPDLREIKELKTKHEILSNVVFKDDILEVIELKTPKYQVSFDCCVPQKIGFLLSSDSILSGDELINHLVKHNKDQIIDELLKGFKWSCVKSV